MAGGGGGARDDHVGPVAAAREEGVVAYLQKEILPYFKLGHRNLNYIQGGPEKSFADIKVESSCYQLAAVVHCLPDSSCKAGRNGAVNHN